MKKTLIITILTVFMYGNSSYGQETMFNLNYSVALPIGELNDYIGKTSFRGFSLSYSYNTSEHLGFGFDLGMHTFYERKDYDTYQDGTASWSGIQYRYTNSYPITAKIYYFKNPEETLNTYIGLGVGALYNQRNTDLGLYNTGKNSWHFSLKPEIGVIYNFTPRFGVKVAGKYVHGFETSEVESLSFIALDAGIVLLKPY